MHLHANRPRIVLTIREQRTREKVAYLCICEIKLLNQMWPVVLCEEALSRGPDFITCFGPSDSENTFLAICRNGAPNRIGTGAPTARHVDLSIRRRRGPENNGVRQQTK